MALGNLITENTKSLCYLLWTFETRIAITIMTDQHEHRDCKEDITMFNLSKTIAQLHTLSHMRKLFNVYIVHSHVTRLKQGRKYCKSMVFNFVPNKVATRQRFLYGDVFDYYIHTT